VQTFGWFKADAARASCRNRGPTYFFYHEGHPSTAVHRIVGKKLFKEIAARSPEAR
jgi:phospholipase/lecithinase/hemolysin